MYMHVHVYMCMYMHMYMCRWCALFIRTPGSPNSSELLTSLYRLRCSLVDMRCEHPYSSHCRLCRRATKRRHCARSVYTTSMYACAMRPLRTHPAAPRTSSEGPHLSRSRRGRPRRRRRRRLGTAAARCSDRPERGGSKARRLKSAAAQKRAPASELHPLISRMGPAPTGAWRVKTGSQGG